MATTETEYQRLARIAYLNGGGTMAQWDDMGGSEPAHERAMLEALAYLAWHDSGDGEHVRPAWSITGGMKVRRIGSGQTEQVLGVEDNDHVDLKFHLLSMDNPIMFVASDEWLCSDTEMVMEHDVAPVVHG